MYRNILVATDLTETSAPALRTALELARSLDAMVTAIHVTEPPVEAKRWFMPIVGDEADFLHQIEERQRKAAQELIDQQVLGAGVELRQDKVRTAVKTGLAAEVIVATAAELGADLIVVGTHGRHGLPHLLLGSVAERVVRISGVPVLSVRAPGK